jgi:hypothetical protein
VKPPVKLPPRTHEEVVKLWPTYRQSILAAVDNCALSTLFDLEGSAFNNAAQARGIIFHRFAAELLRTLRATGEIKIPHEEAMRILYETAAQRDVPDEDVVIVPTRERRTLRICCLALADVPMNMTRLISVEERLTAELEYPGPDGMVKRIISGQPDALLADPPNGAIVLDWKTAPSPPAAPKNGEQSHWTGDHQHVSYEGYFQQRVYALLVMRNYPSVDRVTLREYYVLKKEPRVATVPREALEHIEQELAAMCQTLDRAIMGGSKSQMWRPSPGRHCDYCRRPTSCPIEREARVFGAGGGDGAGGITSESQAARIAAEDVLAVRVHKEAHDALKAWHETTGRPVPVKSAKGRVAYRWGETSSGSRRFGIYPVLESDRGPDDADLAAAFEAAAANREGQ